MITYQKIGASAAQKSIGKTIETPKGSGKACNRLKVKYRNYVCEFCGIYAADKPRCNKCEEEK
jgi:DNA-directed RNA polymerase beta' subunit